ncbi:hypothetical protein HNY73_016561 [Argiope bruennichi]|uniref:H15 domain-containing protein n=1 Tax=Argiope bruennichi TaxID=94029 RepID=A0A8T0EMP1_ARGBR|nr:hypothetical protein HNY73_016561 [Argiope bruennichi]
MPATEKDKIRKWILMAVASVQISKGMTIQQIKKFLDSKQDGLSMKPEMKLILKRLLETGHLKKKEGRYVIKRSKKIPGKKTKRAKSPIRNAGQNGTKKLKSIVRSPSKHN